MGVTKPVLHRFTVRNKATDDWLDSNPDAQIECWYDGKLLTKGDKRQKFCDRNCAKKYWRRARKKPIYKYCDWCGDEFEANRSDRIYCEKKCMQAAGRKRRGIPVLAETEITCNECGKLFVRNHVAQKYCGFNCFFIHRCADKREYNHLMRNGIENGRKYMREILVEISHSAESHMRGTSDVFDKDDWNKRAKQIEDASILTRT